MIVLLHAVLGPGLASEEWVGTITVEERIVGPSDVAGNDRAELDDYLKLLESRLRQARQELPTVPPLVARILRGDVGTYEAELERVALARGGVVTIGATAFVIRGQRMVVLGNGPRLIIDREHGTAVAAGAGKRETIQLAPVSTARELDKGAQEVAVPALGLTARRVDLKAEGKKCQVLVVPGLPNPYALGLLQYHAEDKESLALALSTLPGLPVLVEYTADGVAHRWVVNQIDRRPVDESIFSE
jgi:hypothetical protein